jgi:carboxypeptidase Taq
MNETILEFQERCRTLSDLKAVASILSWDQETMMPAKGATSRARQRATTAAIYHQKLTDPKLTGLIKQLEDMDLNDLEYRSLQEIQREQAKALRLPQRLVEDLAETTATAYEYWVKARQGSDYSTFAPWLEKIIVLKREEAERLAMSESLYENLLDEFEPGMKESELETIFRKVRPHLTRLLERITSATRYSSVQRIEGHFPIPDQERFGREILNAMGFDWEAGRLDKSPHPFCTGFSPLDVRITTRYSPKDFSASLFGVIHEGGHALYEQGLDPSQYGLPICEAISLGIHESQSRLWENHVGRSKDFWSFWLPRLKATFRNQLDDISLEHFVLSVNLVESSPIRVTADEVTYGLHIIVRFELEKALLNGELDVKSLPAEWNTRMESYLGIRPKNDAEGVLQDIHWSHGLVGYFPTYLLGNLYAAQIMQHAEQTIPDLTMKIAGGDLLSLREWLRANVHLLGKVLTANELIQELTGEPLAPDYFVNYLTAKFGALYEL